MEPVEVMIRNSEIHTYKECRLKWNWAYVEHLESRTDSGPLAAGSLAHRVLELWYPKGIRRGAKRPQDLVQQAHRDMIDQGEYKDGIVHKPVTGSDDEDIPVEDLVYQMMENYYDEYGKDSHLKVIAPEMTFQVRVYDRKQQYVGMAVGQIDLTVLDRNTDTVCFYEHKTGADLKPFGAPDELDEQNAMYWTYGPIWLKHLGIIKECSDVSALMYNRLAKNISRDTRRVDSMGRSLNLDGTVSKRQPAPRFLRSPVYRTDKQRFHLDKRFQLVAREMDKARRGKLAIFKNPGRHCNWCEFKDACDVHELGEDYKDTLKLTTRKWKPYKDHLEKEVIDA